MNAEPTGVAPHAAARSQEGQLRRVKGAVRINADAAPSPTQTPSHVPGQAIRLRGDKRRRGAR